MTAVLSANLVKDNLEKQKITSFECESENESIEIGLMIMSDIANMIKNKQNENRYH